MSQAIIGEKQLGVFRLGVHEDFGGVGSWHYKVYNMSPAGDEAVMREVN